MSSAETRSPGKLHTFWINVLMLFCAVLFSLAIAEVFARRYVDTSVWPPFYVGEYENKESENFVVDQDTGWRMRPGHSFVWKIGEDAEDKNYAANAAGFRSDKPFSGTAPVALMGDSFTFGTGVSYEDTYGALLEGELGNTPVYNFAMPGFGVDQMWMALKHQASQFKPKLVVVAFIDEDFDRSLTAFRKTEGFNKPSFILEDGRLRLRTRADQPSTLLKYMRRNLALASMINQNMEQLGHHLPLGSWWTTNGAILQQMMVEARALEAPVLFIRLPSRGQREFPVLSAHMKKMGAHYLDLEGETADYAENEIFIPGDGHINERGHQLVAEAIRDWIDANPGEFVTRNRRESN